MGNAGMRKLGFVSLIVLGVLFVLVIALYLSVDLIARSVIGSAGTSIMGVDTSVGSVDLGIFRKSTTISDLEVRNPPGFQHDHLLAVDEIYIEARVGTVLSSSIDIPVVTLTGFDFDVEEANGKMNVTEVVNNITSQISSGDEDDEGSISLNIQRLEILDINIRAQGKIVNMTGGSLQAKLPSIVLKNVGTKSDDDELVGHLVGIVMDIVIKHIAANPIKGLSNLAISQISGSIRKIPGLQEIGLGAPIADAVESVGRGANNALSGVGNALGQIGNVVGGGNRNTNRQAP